MRPTPINPISPAASSLPSSPASPSGSPTPPTASRTSSRVAASSGRVKDAGGQTCLSERRSVEVAARSAAAGVPTTGGAETPAGSSTSGEADADTTTVTEDGGNGATTTPATDEEAAGARGDMGDTQAPAVSAQEEDVGDDDGAEVETVTSGSAEPSPAADAVSPPSTEAANDNHPCRGTPGHRHRRLAPRDYPNYDPSI